MNSEWILREPLGAVIFALRSMKYVYVRIPFLFYRQHISPS
jgi:hypothetical protein